MSLKKMMMGVLTATPAVNMHVIIFLKDILFSPIFTAHFGLVSNC